MAAPDNMKGPESIARAARFADFEAADFALGRYQGMQRTQEISAQTWNTNSGHTLHCHAYGTEPQRRTRMLKNLRFLVLATLVALPIAACTMQQASPQTAQAPRSSISDIFNGIHQVDLGETNPGQLY
jgi:hypothetical protein